jgi:hypothetical protein
VACVPTVLKNLKHVILWNPPNGETQADMLTALIFINLTISLHESKYETPSTKYGIGVYQAISSQNRIN